MAKYKCPNCDSDEVWAFARQDCVVNTNTGEAEETGGAEWDVCSAATCLECDATVDEVAEWEVV